MARKSPKPEVVAFKVEKELADLLNKLPNKSAFIRKAIAAQLGVACPLCNGKGVVPRGVHDHIAPLLHKLDSRSCDGCGESLHVPLTTQLYFRGDPFIAKDPWAGSKPSLAVALKQEGKLQRGVFDIVLARGL